jgi:4-hydroxy 2-oxovalerate aldolase
LGFLRNPKFDLRPIIRLLQDHIIPLRETVEWGPLIPFNITGQMNRHPRAAIEYRSGDDKDDFVKFYDQIISDI